jgi:hypothetical protein
MKAVPGTVPLPNSSLKPAQTRFSSPKEPSARHLTLRIHKTLVGPEPSGLVSTRNCRSTHYGPCHVNKDNSPTHLVPTQNSQFLNNPAACFPGGQPLSREFATLHPENYINLMKYQFPILIQRKYKLLNLTQDSNSNNPTSCSTHT